MWEGVMNEDKDRALLQILVRLKLQLRFARKRFKDGGDQGREGAIAAINAAAEFVRSIEQFHSDGLAEPLIAISAALTDLKDGAQHPMLVPEPTEGRRPAGMERQALRAAAAATMELAMRAGMSRETAAKMVARHLQNRSVHIGGRQSLTWGTVKRWRDKLRAGSHEDFAVQYYRDIIEIIGVNQTPGADPNSFKQDLLGALDNVLNLLKPN